MELQKLTPSPDNSKTLNVNEKPVKIVAKKPEEKATAPPTIMASKPEEAKIMNRHLVQSPSSEITLVKLVKETPSTPEARRRGRTATFETDSDSDSDNDDEEKITRWPELSEYLVKKEPETNEDYIRILSRMMGVSEDRLTVSSIIHALNYFYDVELKIVECYKKGKKIQSKQVQEHLKNRERLIAELRNILIPTVNDSPKKSKSKS